jgi:hypothetical protein
VPSINRIVPSPPPTSIPDVWWAPFQRQYSGLPASSTRHRFHRVAAPHLQPSRPRPPRDCEPTPCASPWYLVRAAAWLPRSTTRRTRRDGPSHVLQLRSGRDATSAFPEAAKAVAALPTRRALLDGELVTFGQDGRADFELLRARAVHRCPGPPLALAAICVFGLLALDDYDQPRIPLLERKRVLRELLAAHSSVYRDPGGVTCARIPLGSVTPDVVAPQTSRAPTRTPRFP